jgi:hypothetical protein
MLFRKLGGTNVDDFGSGFDTIRTDPIGRRSRRCDTCAHRSRIGGTPSGRLPHRPNDPRREQTNAPSGGPAAVHRIAMRWSFAAWASDAEEGLRRSSAGVEPSRLQASTTHCGCCCSCAATSRPTGHREIVNENSSDGATEISKTLAYDDVALLATSCGENLIAVPPSFISEQEADQCVAVVMNSCHTITWNIIQQVIEGSCSFLAGFLRSPVTGGALIRSELSSRELATVKSVANET